MKVIFQLPRAKGAKLHVLFGCRQYGFSADRCGNLNTFENFENSPQESKYLLVGSYADTFPPFARTGKAPLDVSLLQQIRYCIGI